MTDGQSASLSWCQAPILGLRPDFYYLRLCRCGAPYLTRGRACRLQLLLGFANGVILGSESHGTHDHVLLSQIRDSPSRIYIPQEHGGPVISPGLLLLAGLRSNAPPRGVSLCRNGS
jgi:hypothetical protein